MQSISELSQKILNKYQIKNPQDFYFIFLISGVLFCVAGFLGTYVNLEVHGAAYFKKEGYSSLNFSMPYLGALMGAFVFPQIHSKFSVGAILRSFLILIFGSCLGMMFLLDTGFDFLLRLFLGVSFGILSLELVCIESIVFPLAYRATLFGFIGIELSLSASLGLLAIDYFKEPFEVFGLSMIGIGICYFLVWMWKSPSQNKIISQKEPLLFSKNSLRSFYKIVAIYPLIFLVIFMISNVYGGILSYAAIFFEGIGEGEGEAAVSYSLAKLGALVFLPFAGRIADKCGYQKAFLFSVGFGFFPTVMSFIFPQIDFVVCMFFMIIGSIKAFVMLIHAWISTQYSGKSLSYGMSSLHAIKALSYAIAPLGAGFWMNIYGNNGLLWWILSGLTVSFVLVMLQAHQKTRAFK